uniref:EOG090X0LFN n=1 Tax=Evadne anonyx TaxID=141404 RepID=A0A9N6WU81_9CRUS|nr:EOG090X0LFN [Evadne anonyx]
MEMTKLKHVRVFSHSFWIIAQKDKMAGLVDYGVDSEDDAIRGNSPKFTKVTNPSACDDMPNSDTEEPPNKTLKTKSEENVTGGGAEVEAEATVKAAAEAAVRTVITENSGGKGLKIETAITMETGGKEDQDPGPAHQALKRITDMSGEQEVKNVVREKLVPAIERMGLDVTSLAASVAASGASSEKSAAMAAAQQVLQNQVDQVQQMTGVALPSFYNPGAVNPMKYAQQIQKRKQLWANKEKKEAQPTMTSKIWEATAFNQDQDGKMTAKFKRMMGIKTEQVVASSSQTEGAAESKEVQKKQQELLASLDQQYQVARATTHTQRGLGLGFSSNNSYPR